MEGKILHSLYRYDFVVNFLRPQSLKDAKANFEKGIISKEEFDKIVNEEITKVVAKQKELGYHIITDGEFRRTFWHLDFMWGFEGVGHKKDEVGRKVGNEIVILDHTFLTGKIKAKPHPFVEYFKFLKQFEDENTVAKYTIPSPGQTFQQMIFRGNYETTKKIYPTNEELINDVAKAYQDVVQQFYNAGCRNLQFDDCTWGILIKEENAKSIYKDLNMTVDEIKSMFVKLNNLVLDNRPKDMVITTHICRGNYHSIFFSTGDYEPVDQYLFEKENVDALFLEYDDERSGGFEPLKYVSGNKKVVLGLITSKRTQLEDKEKIIARIHEAAKYKPLYQLCLNPQCGFSSC